MERQGKMEQDQQRLAESLTIAQKKLNDEKRILPLINGQSVLLQFSSCNLIFPLLY